MVMCCCGVVVGRGNLAALEACSALFIMCRNVPGTSELLARLKWHVRLTAEALRR